MSEIAERAAREIMSVWRGNVMPFNEKSLAEIVERAIAESRQHQIPCPSCGGQGRSIITIEMALDAGDRSMSGSEWPCSNCNGDGWILEELGDGEPSPPPGQGEVYNYYVCEGCGSQVNGNELPEAWCEFGQSALRQVGRKSRRIPLAAWCPDCQRDGKMNQAEAKFSPPSNLEQYCRTRAAENEKRAKGGDDSRWFAGKADTYRRIAEKLAVESGAAQEVSPQGFDEWWAESRKLNPDCGCEQRGQRWFKCSYHEGADDAWDAKKEGDTRELKAALKLAKTRLEICRGRFRACHEDSDGGGTHPVSILEITAWIEEMNELLG